MLKTNYLYARTKLPTISTLPGCAGSLKEERKSIIAGQVREQSNLKEQ